MIDVTEQINAVRRRVGKRVLEAGDARVVTIGQTYDAPLEDVWDACTNAERLGRWFLPVSGDLRSGGRYRLEGGITGTIESCDPPKSFTATWEYDGDISWIEIRLSAEPDGRTRFRLEHAGSIDDERWAEFGPGATGVGWDLGLMTLYVHLTSGGAVTTRETDAWAKTGEGKRFMSLSSERWYDANIEAGEDEANARLMADRTTAGYTEQPPPAS